MYKPDHPFKSIYGNEMPFNQKFPKMFACLFFFYFDVLDAQKKMFSFIGSTVD